MIKTVEELRAHLTSRFTNLIDELPTGAVQVLRISEVDEKDRVFYELSQGKGEMQIKSGLFKEITDVKDWLLNDKRTDDIYYLLHHNFRVLKKQPCPTASE